MAVIPLVSETKMVDVGNLISLGNLLDRKDAWIVLTTTSAPLILSCAFGADTWQGLPTYTLVFQELILSHSEIVHTHTHTLSLSLFLSLSYFDLLKQHSLSLSLSLSSFRLPETAWLCQLERRNSIPVTWVRIYSASFFFPVLPFQLDLFQPRTQPQKFRQIPKETTNQHGIRHVLLEYIAILLYIDTSQEILSQHTFYSLQYTFDI